MSILAKRVAVVALMLGSIAGVTDQAYAGVLFPNLKAAVPESIPVDGAGTAAWLTTDGTATSPWEADLRLSSNQPAADGMLDAAQSPATSAPLDDTALTASPASSSVLFDPSFLVTASTRSAITRLEAADAAAWVRTSTRDFPGRRVATRFEASGVEPTATEAGKGVIQTDVDVMAVPEPQSLALFFQAWATSLAAVALRRRKAAV